MRFDVLNGPAFRARMRMARRRPMEGHERTEIAGSKKTGAEPPERLRPCAGPRGRARYFTFTVI